VATLQRIDRLTHQLIYLKRGDDGMPHIALPGADAGQSIDLTPDSRWERVLNFAFGHSPNDLFTSSGSSAIVAQEILSPSVVDNIKQAQLGSLKLEYRMERPPRSQQQALEIRDDAIKLFAGANVFSGGMTIPFSASFRITPMFTLECVIATEPAKSLKLQTEPIFTGHICAKRQQNFRTDSFHALLPSQHCPTV
ncbi:MAG: hypothetical protein RBR06_09555, partial [Desulfuromonadaceae bacterium]|nr:hypothetical protein [Desulfuromonadaceae bacterium]